MEKVRYVYHEKVRGSNMKIPFEHDGKNRMLTPCPVSEVVRVGSAFCLKDCEFKGKIEDKNLCVVTCEYEK